MCACLSIAFLKKYVWMKRLRFCLLFKTPDSSVWDVEIQKRFVYNSQGVRIPVFGPDRPVGKRAAEEPAVQALIKRGLGSIMKYTSKTGPVSPADAEDNDRGACRRDNKNEANEHRGCENLFHIPCVRFSSPPAAAGACASCPVYGAHIFSGAETPMIESESAITRRVQSARSSRAFRISSSAPFRRQAV